MSRLVHDINKSAISIGQNHLNSQLFEYADWLNKKQVSELKEPKLAFPVIATIKNLGACMGYAVAWSYFSSTKTNTNTTTNQIAWWRELLELASEWDHDPLKLTQTIHLKNSDQPLRLEQIFELIASYVIFNFGGVLPDGSALKGSGVSNFLAKGGAFDSAKGRIKSSAVAAGYFFDDDLQELLNENLFSQEGIFLLHAEYTGLKAKEWTRHFCSVHYQEGQWHFYNPDSDVSLFDSKEALIKHIFYVLGNSLAINVSTWDDSVRSSIDEFQNRYNQISSKPGIVCEAGSTLITTYQVNAVDEKNIIAQREKMEDLNVRFSKMPFDHFIKFIQENGQAQEYKKFIFAHIINNPQSYFDSFTSIQTIYALPHWEDWQKAVIQKHVTLYFCQKISQQNDCDFHSLSQLRSSDMWDKMQNVAAAKIIIRVDAFKNHSFLSAYTYLNEILNFSNTDKRTESFKNMLLDLASNTIKNLSEFVRVRSNFDDPIIAVALDEYAKLNYKKLITTYRDFAKLVKADFVKPAAEGNDFLTSVYAEFLFKMNNLPCNKMIVIT